MDIFPIISSYCMIVWPNCMIVWFFNSATIFLHLIHAKMLCIPGIHYKGTCWVCKDINRRLSLSWYMACVWCIHLPYPCCMKHPPKSYHTHMKRCILAPFLQFCMMKRAQIRKYCFLFSYKISPIKMQRLRSIFILQLSGLCSCFLR